MAAPLNPLPNSLIVDRAGVLLAPWQAWLNQLYVYVAQPANAGGVVVPNSRKVNTTAPLTGGGALSSDLTLAIAANGITNSLLATMASDTLKGNNTGATATPTDLTPSQVKTMLAISLTTDVTGTLQAAQFPALTGAVTTTAGSLLTTLSASTVANANLANMAADTLKGNNTGGSATPVDLTVSQVLTMLGIGVGANPTGTVGLSAVNGSATTYMRSDAAPPLSQAIVPTWTGLHTFQGAVGANAILIKGATTGASSGLVVQGGNAASNFCAIFGNAASTTNFLLIFGDGGISIGNPADPGAGSLAVQNNVSAASVGATGLVSGTNFFATAAAGTTGTGQIAYGSTTATTASTTSGGSTLPALAAGYIIVNVAGTARKIPIYAT